MIKKRLKKVIYIIGFIISGLLLVYLGILAFFYFLFKPEPLCGVTLIEEINHPKFDNKAVFFELNCGATTAFSYHVSILPKYYELSGQDRGNIVVYQYKKGDTSLYRTGNKLHINIPSGTKLYKKAVIYNGLELIYE